MTTQEKAQPMPPAQEAESELVERLRKRALFCAEIGSDGTNDHATRSAANVVGPLVTQAADTIETLASLVSHWQIEHELERERATRLEAALREAREELKKAEQFIENGVEFGFIRMPDADTPDSAHDRLPSIRAVLARTALGGGV